MKKLLLVFRLFDPTYTRGNDYGNTETLTVTLREDNTLSYSLYGGWQDSGTPMSITNLGLKKSLPINPAPFKTTRELEIEIRTILATGFGSHHVAKTEMFNEIKAPKPKASKQKLIDAVIEDLKVNSFAYEDYTVLEELLSFIPRENLIKALPEDQWKNFQ